MENKNIFQRMQAATAEIAAVAKNLQVDTGNGRGYKAVGEADVLAAVKPIEAKHGIYSYPVSRQIIESGEIVTTTKYGERKSLFMRLETVYRFVNAEKPDEYIDITTYGDGVDSQDKAPGKAMTYGDKYALLKAYKIQTGDDPDAEASGDLQRKETKQVNRNTPAGARERQIFQEACERKDLDPVMILSEVGWKTGQKMTYGHYADAMKVIAGRG